MKILKKGTSESTTEDSSCKNFLIVFASLIGVCVVVYGLVLAWPSIVKGYNDTHGGWETKIVSKTYPVSHIRITNESDYYDDNQKNAGYALVNYKALLDKGDMIALNVIKTNALEGNSSRYSYEFQVDEINYKSTKIIDVEDSLRFLIEDPDTNKFSEIKYKKDLKEPEATVYYKLKYQHGKLKSKELKRDATLILPE